MLHNVFNTLHTCESRILNIRYPPQPGPYPYSMQNYAISASRIFSRLRNKRQHQRLPRALLPAAVLHRRREIRRIANARLPRIGKVKLHHLLPPAGKERMPQVLMLRGRRFARPRYRIPSGRPRPLGRKDPRSRRPPSPPAHAAPPGRSPPLPALRGPARCRHRVVRFKPQRGKTASARGDT